MFTSLLSLYIAATIQPEILPEAEIEDNEPAIVQVASIDFINYLDTTSFPIKDSKYISPIIDATGSIAVDLESEEILFEKNSHKKLQIASITKLMTAIIILDENSLDELVTISNNAANTEGSTMFLRSGEQITVKNLIYGVMINSANDAAVALAEYNSGSVATFVEKMNKKAEELKMINTNFANPTGLDNSNNYSTAYEVAILGKYCYGNEFIREAAQTKELNVYSENGNYMHKLKSTNKLLDSYLNIKGLKTGKTDAAGLCLVSIAENDSKNEIITVVLDSPARFTETKILIDWVFRAYNW